MGKQLNGKIVAPFKKDWLRLQKVVSNSESENLDAILINHFKSKQNTKHQRVRKVYSLPIITGQGKLLFARKSWDNNRTLQILNDSDSRKIDNKTKDTS